MTSMINEEAMADLRSVAADKNHSGGVILQKTAQWALGRIVHLQQILLECLSNEGYVAWLCYKQHENGYTTIHVCDSDARGAFKVWRWPRNTQLEQERNQLIDCLNKILEHVQSDEHDCNIRGPVEEFAKEGLKGLKL